MDKQKRQRLEAAGWIVEDTSDFLDLTPAESQLVELKVKLALLLKEKRKKQDLSQTELAVLMNSSQSRVAKIEASDPSVSLDLTLRALFSTGVTCQELAQVIGQDT